MAILFPCAAGCRARVGKSRRGAARGSGLFYSKVFREEAVARRARPEPLDARLQVTAPHEWLVLLGVCLALLAVVAWTAFGKVERSLSAPAVIVQPGERVAVVAPASGNVIEVSADVGEFVEAGQAIGRVSLPEAAQQARVTRRLMDQVQDAARAGGDAASDLYEALLAAAGRELRAVEVDAAALIVAPAAGTLTAHQLLVGQPVRAGQRVAQLRGASDGAWEALAFMTAAGAERLQAGMAAELLLAPSGSEQPPLTARVVEASMTPILAPDWLADLGLSTQAPANLVRLAIDGDPPADLRDGTHATMRLVLETQSPAALLVGAGG